MTRSSVVSPITRYTCNGVTTAFPTLFQFLNDDELKVVFIPADTTIAETTLTLTTNYTVSGGSDETGTVTTTGDDPLGNDPYDSGDLVIIRETPLTQEIESRTTGAFRPPNIESAFDKTCDQMQEREALSELALRLPDTTDLTEVSCELPAIEASRFIATNSSATEFIFAAAVTGVPVSTYGASLIDDPTAASALETLTVTTLMRSLLDDLTTASALETLSLTTLMRTLVTDAVQASALQTLGTSNAFRRSGFSPYDTHHIRASGLAEYMCKEKYCRWEVPLITPGMAIVGDVFWYLYLDYSEITAGELVTASGMVWSTTKPTWNTTYGQHMNGDDTCIFSVLASGTAIFEFQHDGDYVGYADEIEDKAHGAIGSDWANEITLTVPSFVRRVKAYFEYKRVDVTTTALWRTEGQTGAMGHLIGTIVPANDINSNTIDVICSTLLKIDVREEAAAANTLRESTQGWYLPLGM